LQSYNLYSFNQIFLPISEDFFLRFFPESFEELIAFFKADGKDTRSIFISKFFLRFSLTPFQHLFTRLLLICYTVCKELSAL